MPQIKTNRPETLKGNLSVFQQVMRQWAGLHPYNAVHVFRLEGRADIGRLTESIDQTWQAFDFGRVAVAKRRYGFFHPADQPSPGEIDVIAACEDPTPTINAHLTELLNVRFPAWDYAPVRFSVIQSPACHYLCVTYDHWIGDGEALRILVRPILCRYCGDPADQTDGDEAFRDDAQKPTFYPPTYRTAYHDHFGSKAKRLIQWWHAILANNVTILVPSHGESPMYAEYLSCDLPDEAMQNVSSLAKQHGVTVHDVFLAAITRAVMPFLPEHLVRRKRKKMGIGTIVNARGPADVDLGDAVGVYLGYFITHCRADQADTLGKLAQQIAKKTSVIKNNRAYLNTAIGMKIQCLLWPIIPQPARAAFLRNSLPLTAGITNTYIKDPWMLALHEHGPRRLLGYFRAAPTGPIIPISFTPTTLAGKLHLGITWRPSCFDRDTIETMTKRIENDLLASESYEHL